jgi:hypothetical protein
MKFRYQKFLLGPYDPRKPLLARPFIPILLMGPKSRTPSPFYALLDSGADRVILPADLAEAIGVKPETGIGEAAVGIAGQRATVHYHLLNVEVVGEGRPLAVDVGFSQIVVPLLGRSFFRHYKAIVFRELAEEVELRP